jgi:hypothetical protein
VLSVVLASTAGADVFRSEPNLVVPDNDANGVTDTQQANPSCTINDVDIAIEMNHTWVGDLIFRITHNNVTVTIVDRPGVPNTTFGCGSDAACDRVIVLDDESVTPIETFCINPFPAGSYGPNEALSAFDGMDQSGDWEIFVSDNAQADTGTLCAWEVRTTCGVNPVQASTWGAIKEYFRE